MFLHCNQPVQMPSRNFQEPPDTGHLLISTASQRLNDFRSCFKGMLEKVSVSVTQNLTWEIPKPALLLKGQMY